jgi:hypothetical protein
MIEPLTPNAQALSPLTAALITGDYPGSGL